MCDSMYKCGETVAHSTFSPTFGPVSAEERKQTTVISSVCCQIECTALPFFVKATTEFGNVFDHHQLRRTRQIDVTILTVYLWKLTKSKIFPHPYWLNNTSSEETGGCNEHRELLLVILPAAHSKPKWSSLHKGGKSNNRRENVGHDLPQLIVTAV